MTDLGMGGFPGVRKFFLPLLRQLFPPACPLCSHTFSSEETEVFCSACMAGFKALPEAYCPVCALPFAGVSNSSHLCSRCTLHPPSYEKVYTVGLYEQSLRYAIHQFKFNRKVSLDRSLGVLLEQAVDRNLSVDLIVPIPLSRQRLQQRSYNQALLLAREFAKIRQLSLASNLLVKVRDTESQQGLSAVQRGRNLQGAFKLRGEVPGRTVLLVDDVMTTGTTVEACSQILLAGGAKAVYVAVIGRAA
ncbi:MAG: ComF family protein [Desulfuromusa sp.]|jgi:ComF family protein|nr:ComF family protein [Desulfuromusa sp.]